jgi:hypothetical protein
VATSRSFLSGTPHLVGSGAAVVGMAGGFLAGGPALLSLGIGAAAYAAGFLLAPRRRRSTVAGVDDLEDGRRATEELARFCTTNSADLGPELTDLVRRTVAVVQDVLGAWAELRTSPADRHSVESVVGDHLPTVLRNHLALPPDLRTDAARDQVGVLLAELERVRELAWSGAVRRVEVQGLFLKDRFDRENPFDRP